MNFTYKQPYVTWKGPSTGSAVPTWSRPLINDNSKTNTGTSFAARPIKHWRKQLVPAANTGISKNASVGMPMDRPGGSAVYLGSAGYLGATNDCSNCRVNLYELIPTTKNTIFNNTKASDGKCVACNPETNIIKSGITLLNNNYYSDTKAYLQSLCQTYDQKLSTIPIIGNKYINPTTHQPFPPSDSPTGSQLYYTENCSQKCATENSVVRTVYKPNNQQYAQQGAVTSSSRLTRLKNNTITKNGNSFNSAWGQQAANNGRYQGTSDGPYFLKTKNQECVPPHRAGNKTTSCIVNLIPVPVPVPVPPPEIYGSLYFNNEDDNQLLLIRPIDNVLDLSTATANSFTIETYIYPTLIEGTQNMIFVNNNSASGNNMPMSFSYNMNDNSLKFYFFPLGSASATTIIGTGQDISLNTWNHMALSVNNGTVRMFIQGQQLTLTNDVSFNGVEGYQDQILIGDWAFGEGNDIKGYLTNYRINNTTGIYTTNFTPSFPLTAITGTTLLLLANQNSPKTSSTQNNVQIFDEGNIQWDPLTV